MVAMSLVRDERGPWGTFMRAVRAADEQIHRAIDGPAPAGSLLAALKQSGATRAELRDQVVTILAAGHETTAGSLAWALERLARHPDVLDRIRHKDEEYLDATVKEVLRVRPVLTIAARRVKQPFEVGGHVLPPGVHVAPCIYLAHRRREAWPEPTAFRPERFLERQPAPYTYLPFGGGVRRCAGAPFAEMEVREVLRAAAELLEVSPAHRRPEQARRSALVVTPDRGGEVLARAR